MSTVLWLLLLIAAVAIVAWWSRPRETALDGALLRAATELHAIRRRLDVARLKTDVRVDAARLRRELRDDLDRADS